MAIAVYVRHTHTLNKREGITMFWKRFFSILLALAMVVMALAACAFGAAAEESPEPTDTLGVSSAPEETAGPVDTSGISVSEAQPLPGTPDLNRNGVPETLTIREIGDRLGRRLELWEDGTVIWSEEGFFNHMGYTAVFLCTLDGEDYLLRYHPYACQGGHTYSYALFTLENGEEAVVRENNVCFDLNFGYPKHESFDPEAIAAFMNEVNDLLAHSVQLLNTDKERLDTLEKNGRLEDTLGWLDQWEEEFIRNEDKSLLENLREFQQAVEENN